MLEEFESYDFEITHYKGTDRVVCVPGVYYLSIGPRAFYKNKTIQEVTVTEGVREIKKEAFAMCKNLVRITLPASIVSIEERAFSGCKNLIEVVLHDKLWNIHTTAFDDWQKITITRR